MSYLAYGKAVTLDGSPARLVLGATTKLFVQNINLSVHSQSQKFQSHDGFSGSIKHNGEQIHLENLILKKAQDMNVWFG